MDKGFQYTYSAKEQNEIQNIRKKYEVKEEDKLDRLRKMDAQVTKKGTAISLILGIFGALIMGFGMSLVMTDLGSRLGLPYYYVFGIVIGIVGMIPVCLAYPVYMRITRKERERIAPEVLRLSEELLKQ
ncbi:MAG: hypothetical protein IJ336_06280 [Lachnospiraceae bacterium]|nr:hypothetical protein [Lachnospiraceae bacterium]MBQ7833165.1 hypothetical protein [Lachnospiraceae bacterium]